MQRLVPYLCVLIVLVAGCQQQPQPVRHLHEKVAVDSTLLKQLEFNARMAEAADRECIAYVKQDSLTYAQDSIGFWYAKVKTTDNAPIRIGQKTELHLTMADLSGNQRSDVQGWYSIGNDNLPQAIYVAIKMMREGEEICIVAPWYTMYGVEGNEMVRGYENLRVEIKCLTINENDKIQ